MNGFDYTILSYFSKFADHSPSFDQAVTTISDNGLLRDGLIVIMLWWAWFKDAGTAANDRAREYVLTAIATCLLSIALARALVLVLPFRIRPIADHTNGLHFPGGVHDWENWSAFPSDHAILFFTLTTCLFFISKPMGWLALIDTIFLVCLPRVYLGIHHPTDILAGAGIGVATGFIANQRAFRSFISRGTFEWVKRHPSSFYAIFFLFTYELVDSFWDFRLLAKALIKVVVGLTSGSS